MEKRLEAIYGDLTLKTLYDGMACIISTNTWLENFLQKFKRLELLNEKRNAFIGLETSKVWSHEWKALSNMNCNITNFNNKVL